MSFVWKKPEKEIPHCMKPRMNLGEIYRDYIKRVILKERNESSDNK